MRYLALVVLLSVMCVAEEVPPCVIVKRHNPKFGENASRLHPHRPFDFVEGAYPSGYKWRSELGDGDVREVQGRGGKVVVMRSDYGIADLDDARKQCRTDAK